MSPLGGGCHPRRSNSEGVTKSPITAGLKRGFGCAVVLATVAFSAAGSSLPEVGSAALPLDLKASDGMSHSLATGDGPRVLIFFRGLW